MRLTLALTSLFPFTIFNSSFVTERCLGLSSKASSVLSTFSSSNGDLENLKDTYDFIVIGGGTAGLAVASRLSEDPKVNVVVLEAGHNVEHLPEVYIPNLIGRGQSFTTLNWAYQTTPQRHLNGRRVAVGAGKALGGSTIINSMIFPRGPKHHYDTWSLLNDNSPYWTWNALLPYFKRSEEVTPPNQGQVEEGAGLVGDVHGLASNAPSPPSPQTPLSDPPSNNPLGKVKVGFPNYFFPQYSLWRASSKLNLPHSRDMCDGVVEGKVGVSINSLDAVNNTRCSSVCAYLIPRPNLTVLTNITVTRILWDRSSSSSSESTFPSSQEPLRAIAVEFTSTSSSRWIKWKNERRTINVRKEVILSAGTIGSPKVLEMSGVGNGTILRKAGVEPVMELPTVGENLADHVHGWASAFTNASLTKDSLLLSPELEKQQLELWHANRTGILSAAPRSIALLPASSLFSSAEIEELVKEGRQSTTHWAKKFANGNEALQKGLEMQFKIVLDMWENKEGKGSAPVELNVEPGYSGPTPFASRPPRKFTSINAVLFSPLSRGRTHIASSNPFNAPQLDPAYYAHPLDMKTHVRSIQLSREILKAPPLDRIYEGEFEPGKEFSASRQDVDKEDEGAGVERWAREVSTSDNHVVGSLAMMPKELGGVVDTRLRVYGVLNLRVVDASVIPMPISTHLMSTVYAIAERAADFIQEDQIDCSLPLRHTQTELEHALHTVQSAVCFRCPLYHLYHFYPLHSPPAIDLSRPSLALELRQ